MSFLFPEIAPYVQHSIKVESPHVIHVEECGNPSGIPVLFVHGGPGAGCEAYHRRFFDPELYRIILFDQRGCGRSTPHASLENNTTQALVSDIEVIRKQLEVDRWVLFGGSWGSTLSLVYAQTYPDHVAGLILRGIFLCRPREIQWFYQSGASRLFPDYWESFIEVVAEEERDDMVAAYHRLLNGTNELVRMSAAKAWSMWEGRTATLLPQESVINHLADPFTALSMARIENHYFINDSFLEPDQILRGADRLKSIDGVIVQGRYDAVCPMESAWALHQAWPEADFNVINDAGHSASEEGITRALVKATGAMGRRLL